MSTKNNSTEVQKPKAPVSNTYYKLGLRYLISGVQECLAQMQECDQNSKEGQGELFKLSNDLVQKIGQFCGNHLESDQQGPQLDSFLTRPGALPSLEQELSSAKKSNRRLKRANLRLKKRVRTLKVNLSQVKYGLARYVDSVEGNSGSEAEAAVSEAKEEGRSEVRAQEDDRTVGTSIQADPERGEVIIPQPETNFSDFQK